ncbi:hypothetical protein COL5a_005607 [Colletotrichum fioriniae]|nr:hypothetical protein COL5a_005607 [Colletotrichum fioriniae]
MAETTENRSQAPEAPAAPAAAPPATTPPVLATSPPTQTQASPPTGSPVDAQQIANDVTVEADEGETTDNASTIDERM